VRLKIRITVDDGPDCADYYMHTGHIVSPTVKTVFREIEIPDLKKGWGIRGIDIEANDEVTK